MPAHEPVVPHTIAATEAVTHDARTTAADASTSYPDEPTDAQDWLVDLIRRNQPLYLKRATPDGPRCDEIRFVASTHSLLLGTIPLGDRRGDYLIEHGHLTFDRSEPLRLHGAGHAGILLSGSLLATSKEAAVSNPTSDGGPPGDPNGVHDFARDLLAEERTLYVPVLREDSVHCAAVDLSRPRGTFPLPSYSGKLRALEYRKDELGIEIWRASTVEWSAVGRRVRGAQIACDMTRVRLAVHGRDASAYHVDGSRWFIDAGACEREHEHVLPALVDLVNLRVDVCPADPHLAALPVASLRSGTYFVAQPDATMCRSVEVVTLPRGHRVLARAVGVSTHVSSFEFEPIAAGRFAWRIFAHRSDVVPLRPFAGGIALGGERWYTEKTACEKSLTPP